jgi:hypothetical protein
MLLADGVYCPAFVSVVMMVTVGFRYLTHKHEYVLEFSFTLHLLKMGKKWQNTFAQIEQ